MTRTRRNAILKNLRKLGNKCIGLKIHKLYKSLNNSHNLLIRIIANSLLNVELLFNIVITFRVPMTFLSSLPKSANIKEYQFLKEGLQA
jgi:hypothetical protein